MYVRGRIGGGDVGLFAERSMSGFLASFRSRLCISKTRVSVYTE